MGALLAKEWPVALSEIYRVLKPGGAVQLIEMDSLSPTPVTPMTSQIIKRTSEVCDRLGLQLGIAGSLAALAKATGFVDIVDETRRLPLGKTWGEIGLQGTFAVAGAYRSTGGMMVKAGAFASKEEHERLVNQIVEEWDVHGTHYPCKVICARKPA